MPRKYRAFTLIELLVVVAVIALLIAILLPSLALAKEKARQTRCAANLHGIGTAILVFGYEHNDTPPGQIMNATVPKWGSDMYTRHYFQLMDKYGVKKSMFTCPGVVSGVGGAPATPRLPYDPDDLTWYPYFPSPTTSEDLARADDRFLPDVVAFTAPSPYPGCTYPLADYAFEFTTYQYLAFGNAKTPAAWQVVKLNMPTTTGTPNDYPAPLMADMTCFKVAVDDDADDVVGPPYLFNHGHNWSMNGFDTTTLRTTSHIGTPKMNVLYSDGHVAYKAPELQAYAKFAGTYWFY